MTSPTEIMDAIRAARTEVNDAHKRYDNLVASSHTALLEAADLPGVKAKLEAALAIVGHESLKDYVRWIGGWSLAEHMRGLVKAIDVELSQMDTQGPAAKAVRDGA